VQPASARAFLSRYVAADGRVLRRDQGGDVVSEGQAYAMLVSVAVGDRATFGRVWSWTRTHLQRRDGLLASGCWRRRPRIGGGPSSSSPATAWWTS
jgi:endo-1,4-beta-D-glucanase Y